MSAKVNDGTKREFFPQLTSVRFFAAFIVVCYHYHDELRPYLPGLLKNVIDHGYIGVSFFFILSGFILGANYYDRLLQKRVTKADFWWARFSRIYPVYILSILVFLPRLLLPAAKDPFPVEAAYAQSHVPELFVTVIFLLQCFASKLGGYLNSPTWSISTEVFFYLLLPFLLPLLDKIKTKQLWTAIIICFLLAGVGPFLYHADWLAMLAGRLQVPYTRDLDEFINQFIRVNFLTRLPEFLVGVLGYRLYREVLQKHHMAWVFGVGFVLSIPFLIKIFFETEKDVVYNALYTGQFYCVPFFFTIILGLVTLESKATAWLKHPGWILMGEASFSLYLFHVPIKNFGQYVLARALHVDKDNIIVALVLMVLAVLVSIPIFKYLETPVRKKLTAWWKQRHTPAVNP